MDARREQTQRLANGTEMPLLGWAFWQIDDGPRL